MTIPLLPYLGIPLQLVVPIHELRQSVKVIIYEQ